jgi:hypothetical protein
MDTTSTATATASTSLHTDTLSITAENTTENTTENTISLAKGMHAYTLTITTRPAQEGEASTSKSFTAWYPDLKAFGIAVEPKTNESGEVLKDEKGLISYDEDKIQYIFQGLFERIDRRHRGAFSKTGSLNAHTIEDLLVSGSATSGFNAKDLAKAVKAFYVAINPALAGAMATICSAIENASVLAGLTEAQAAKVEEAVVRFYDKQDAAARKTMERAVNNLIERISESKQVDLESLDFGTM